VVNKAYHYSCLAEAVSVLGYLKEVKTHAVGAADEYVTETIKTNLLLYCMMLSLLIFYRFICSPTDMICRRFGMLVYLSLRMTAQISWMINFNATLTL